MKRLTYRPTGSVKNKDNEAFEAPGGTGEPAGYPVLNCLPHSLLERGPGKPQAKRNCSHTAILHAHSKCTVDTLE